MAQLYEIQSQLLH